MDISNGSEAHQVEVSGHHANSLVGKKIGDEVDGIFVSLPGYKLQITGGSDGDGFVMRKDIPGISRRKILLTKSVGFKPDDRGVRRKKTVCGNTISLNTSQINMKVIEAGSKPMKELLEAAHEEKDESA
ncbi:MAG: 30S ribosomal protein S6e [Thermoplasmatota archaeon]